MDQYKVLKLIQPEEFVLKYPFVVYKYVKNGRGKPLYTAKKQFRTLDKAYEYIDSKLNQK